MQKRKKPAWPLTTLSMKRVFFWRQISSLQYMFHTILEVTSGSQLAGFSSSQFELEFRFVTHKIINTLYNSDSHNLVHLQVPGNIMLVLITVSLASNFLPLSPLPFLTCYQLFWLCSPMITDLIGVEKKEGKHCIKF